MVCFDALLIEISMVIGNGLMVECRMLGQQVGMAYGGARGRSGKAPSGMGEKPVINSGNRNPTKSLVTVGIHHQPTPTLTPQRGPQMNDNPPVRIITREAKKHGNFGIKNRLLLKNWNKWREMRRDMRDNEHLWEENTITLGICTFEYVIFF